MNICRAVSNGMVRWEVTDPPTPHEPYPAATGLLERIFFTLVVGYSGVGVGAGTMMVWLGLKTLINWRRYESKEFPTLLTIVRATQVSVFTGMLSLLFALVGGLIVGVAISPSPSVKFV